MYPVRVLLWNDISEVSKNHMWDAAKEENGNLPTIDQVFFETRRKGGILVEPEDINKHVEIVKTMESEPSLTNIEVIKKCFSPQKHNYVFCCGGEMKRKDFKESNSTYVKRIETELKEIQEENRMLKRSLQEQGSRLEKLEEIIMQALAKTPRTYNNELDEVNMSIVILPMLEEFNLSPATVVI
ncbi:hypothetical protein Scep_019871 [Stephania cephalantha]|uniref:Uncharacterized protein n=1 Tax=Stephania cephalantha TaxID=152367 RepID=A0AAP0IC42_9MAGN